MHFFLVVIMMIENSSFGGAGALGLYKFHPFPTPSPPGPMYIQLVVNKVQPCNNMLAHSHSIHYPFFNFTNNLLSC